MGKQGTSTVVNKLKKAYFFFEDKYYSLLDKVNEKIPVYKVIDPVDNYVPSFIVLILLFLFMLLFFFALSPGIIQFVSSLFLGQGFSAHILVVDEGNTALENANISVLFEGGEFQGETNESGRVELSIPSRLVEASLLVEKQGFLDFEGVESIEADTETEITLKAVGSLTGPSKTIQVLDSKSNKLLSNTTVRFSFDCSSSVSPPAPQTTSTGKVIVSETLNCGTLLATVSASGYYSSKNYPVTKSFETIRLSPIEDEPELNSILYVFVQEKDYNAVSGAEVKLFDSFNSLAEQSATDSSGSAVFEGVMPGTYTVRVSEGSRLEEREVSLQPGSTETISFILSETQPDSEDEGKKLFLKFVDSESDAPLQGVRVQFYINNSIESVFTTYSNGLFEKKDIPIDSNAVISIVAWKQGYVTKIILEENLIIMDNSKDTPQKIMFHASNEQNSGTIEIAVTDYDTGNELEGVEVFLFNESNPEQPLNLLPSTTDRGGRIVFEDMPPDSYFAKARHEEKEGFSVHESLAPGSILSLEISLVLSQGIVNVFALNEYSGDEIQRALVQIFQVNQDSSTEQIQEGETNEDGEYSSFGIDSDKTVVARVSKQGYLSYLSPAIDIIGNAEHELFAFLKQSANFDSDSNIVLELEGVYSDSSTSHLVNKIVSGSSYFLKFDLVVSTDKPCSDLVFHSRAGNDSSLERESVDYVIDFFRLDKVSASGNPLIVFSKCFSPDSVFSSPVSCSGSDDSASVTMNAKQANIYWGIAQPKTVYSIVLPIFIEQNLPDGTKADVRWRAKAVIDGSEFETTEFMRSFVIGETFCVNDCPAFLWDFILVNGENRESLDSFNIENPFALELSKDYVLDFTVQNTSKKSFSNATVSLENLSPPDSETSQQLSSSSLSISSPSQPHNIINSQFPADSEISSNNSAGASAVEFSAVQESALTTLSLLYSTSPSIEAVPPIIYFTVEPQGFLEFENLPEEVSPSLSQIVSGTVIAEKADGTRSPVSNSLLLVEIDGTPVLLPDNLAYSEDQGEFSIEFVEDASFALTSNPIVLESLAKDSIKLTATASGFSSAEATVGVGERYVFDPSYDCILVEPAEIEIETGSSSQLTVTADNCFESVEIVIASDLPVSQTSFNLSENESKTIRISVSEETVPGIYTSLVKARFESDVSFFNASSFRSLVSDPDSCFEISKSSFDFTSSETDIATITNKCYQFISDQWIPRYSIDNSRVELSYQSNQPDSPVTFQWWFEADLVEHIEMGTQDGEVGEADDPNQSAWGDWASWPWQEVIDLGAERPCVGFVSDFRGNYRYEHGACKYDYNSGKLLGKAQQANVRCGYACVDSYNEEFVEMDQNVGGYDDRQKRYTYEWVPVTRNGEEVNIGANRNCVAFINNFDAGYRYNSGGCRYNSVSGDIEAFTSQDLIECGYVCVEDGFSGNFVSGYTEEIDRVDSIQSGDIPAWRNIGSVWDSHTWINLGNIEFSDTSECVLFPYLYRQRYRYQTAECKVVPTGEVIGRLGNNTLSCGYLCGLGSVGEVPIYWDDGIKIPVHYSGQDSEEVFSSSIEPKRNFIYLVMGDVSFYEVDRSKILEHGKRDQSNSYVLETSVLPNQFSYFSDPVVKLKTNREDIVVWQEGTSIYAKFVGSEEDEDNSQATEIVLRDVSLDTTQSAFIKAEDYSQGLEQ